MLFKKMIAKFSCSGEIKFKVTDIQVMGQKIFDHYTYQNPQPMN